MKGAVGKVADSTVAELLKIIDLVRGQLTKLNRATLAALVTMDVHARDVTRHLADLGVSEASDFQWTSQLRMYWEEDTVPVRMMNASIEYGYAHTGRNHDERPANRLLSS
jgi:dynein heavy chain